MPLPPGFVLEEPSGSSGLPPGFQLEGAPAPVAPTPEGGFVPAVQRGLLQTGSLLFDVLPGMVAKGLGAEEYAQKQFQEAAETERKIQEKYAAAVPSYKDIKGVGDAVTYITESVGELIPSILPSIFTGGVAGVVGRGAVIAAKEAAEQAVLKEIAKEGAGAVVKKEAMDAIAAKARQAGIDAARNTALKYDAVGAITGSALQNVPDVYQNIKEETGQDSLGSALLFGGFNSLLDAALPLSLMAKARKAGIPNEAIVGEWYKRFGKGAAKGFATEGATEAAQEMSSAAAAKFVDENQEFFSEKNLERFLNAGLKGGLGGGVVSGTTDVVLGKKPLTPEQKPLDEDIRQVQGDILARRDFLDELRKQAEEEGRNRLDEGALKDLGFRKGDLYDQLIGKDINDPLQVEQIQKLLTGAVEDPNAKKSERIAALDTLGAINQYQTTLEAPDVGEVVGEPSGEGAGVAGVPSAGAAPAGLAPTERVGMVPPVAPVGEPTGREAVTPAPVEVKREEPALPAVQEPVPSAAPAAVEAPTAAPAPQIVQEPTTKELIAEQEAGLAKQMERFQNLLQEQVKRYGLQNVGVNVATDLERANGLYSNGLIKLAFDAKDPVRDLRHESIHAMKELNFFTPGQWDALVRRANEAWIDTYLKNRNINGDYLTEGEQSRYDAYVQRFKENGKDDAYIQEALIEEAIADAFGDFSQTKAPPGMLQAILNRIKNFFRSLKDAITGAEITDPERIFGKIEAGEMKAPPSAPKTEVAAPPEQKTEVPEVKASIAAPRPEPVSTAPENQVISNVAKKLPLSKKMFDSTSLGMQTGKSGKEQFEKQKIGGIPEIISFLERRRRASGLKVLDIANESDRIVLSDLMTAEALASIDAGGAALEWYDETIAKTIGMAALKYPDLATNPDKQMAFKLATAIASQGMNVEDNLKFAMRQYDYFDRNGRFEEIGTGTDAKAMKTNYELANLMFDKYKLEKTRRFLATPFTVEELRSAGFEVGGELGEETVLGSSIFGPKIGFGFYSNLNGNFEPVTMDMWFMRLIGRLTGKLRALDERLLGEQIKRFRDTFAEAGTDGVYASDFTEAELNKARENDEDAIELARVVNSVFNSEFSKANLRELYDAGARQKTAFVNAAQRILTSVDSPKDAPQNGTERQQLRDVVRRTVSKIEKVLGKRIPPASLQALVWYPEQELYASLGAKLRVTSQDYAGAMKGLLEGEGYGRADLDQAAENGARRVRGVAVEPAREETVPVGREPRAAFGEEEREAFLEEKRTERVVEQERKKPRRHKVVFEVAPDPNEAALTDEWRKLDADKRLDISNRVAAKILPRVLELINANGRTASQVGSYLDDTNPSFALYLDKGSPVEVSQYLGYVLGQDSMMVISPRPASGLEMVGAVVVDINSQDPAVVDSVYQQLREIRVNDEQPVGGQSTINGKMVVLNYSNLTTDALAEAISNKLNGAYDVAVTDVYSAFPEKDSYDYSDPQADPRGKAGALRQAARTLRREATQLLAAEIGYKPTKAREEKPVGEVKYSISGKRITDTPELREAAKQSAIVDADGKLIPMYHGTGALIRVFRPKQAGATFVTPSPGFATGFASESRRWMVRHIGQFLKPDEVRKAVQELRQAVYAEYGKQSKMTSKIMDEIHDVLRESKETGVYNFKGELEDMWTPIAYDMIPGAKERVMELYVLAKNPFDFANKADVNKVIKKMMADPEVKRQYGYERAPAGIDLQKPENFMLRQTLERSDKDFKAAVEDKFKEDLSRGSWKAIETPEVQRAIRKLNFDSFYVIEGGVKNLGVYDPRLIKSADENVGPFGQRPPTEAEAADVGMTVEEAEKAQKEGDIRLSLRSRVDPALTRRMLQTTTAREEKTYVERITEAIGPKSRSQFRAAALNRYNALGEADKKKIAMSGGIDLYADSTAEGAALSSDLAAGLAAGALGVYDKIGGTPVYNKYYVVEKTIPGPQGDQIVTVGGNLTDKRVAESVARRVNGKVMERGFVSITNKDNTIKGPLAIFAPLAKYGDPDIYRYYQLWAGIKRGSKWVANPNGTVTEKLFNDPNDQAYARQLEKQFPEFVDVQKEWIKYNDALVQFMVDTGVISKANGDKFREHGDYIPFYRQMDGDADAVGPRIFQSIGAVKAPRKIKGGEDLLGDFLENVVRNTQSSIQAGIKNIAARRAADVGMSIGVVAPVGNATPDPVNSFHVLENGEKVYYDSGDHLFVEAVKSLGIPEIPFIGILSAPANVLRNLVTKDPGFMLANMMRDSLAAYVTSGVNMTPIAATLNNFKDVLANQSPEFRALQNAGILGGYEYSRGTIDAAKEFGKELRKTSGKQTAGEKAMKPFTSLWEGLEKGTQASDAATRIEVYKATLRETNNEAEALFRALEVMNFNRKGNSAIVRIATAAIPFLNARIQGLDVLYRAGFGKNATKNAQSIQKAFWVRGMTMAALSSMYWLLTHDDDDYKKQEQETKDNNWLFPSLGIKVPIPFEIGVLFKVVPERIMALTFGEDTAKDFTQSMARNLASNLIVTPIPQAALPVIEAATNFSFFTQRPIVGQGMADVAPAYQIGPGTSRLAENLGKMLNLSPMMIDHVIKGYTGTIGTYMSDTIDTVWDMHTDNPKASKRFEQLPVVKRFAVDPEARGQVTTFYDLKNATDEATRTANLLERSMNFEEYGKYMTENVKMLATKDYILDLEKSMKEYRDLKNMIRNMPMDADRKRDAITAIGRIESQLVSNIQILKKQMQ